jgi:formylglycine-generating enzyme required for sulfatase activity
MKGASDNSPVYNADWDDAQQYVKWLSKKTGFEYRLPSEAEWEYAAEAGTEKRLWWGDAPGVHANCRDCGGPYDRLRPLPVGSFPANPFGLYDMNGGVAEWVEDCWHPDYAGAPQDAKPRISDGCRTRTLRGGSWRDKKTAITAKSRWEYDQSVRYVANGFRVSRNVK